MIQKELARLIIKFENWQTDEIEKPCLMVSVYTEKKSNITCGICGGKYIYPPNDVGDYIGSLDNMTVGLLVKKGILPEKADPNHNVCSIGKSFKDGKWYGWSHRAIFGFAIGDEVKEGDCCNTPGVTDEYLKEHPEEDKSLPVGFIAKTEEDCKKMAIAFCGKCFLMSKSTRKKLILANDALFRQIIHLRDRVCQKTGKTENLQVAHFWRRSILRTRWDCENACLLNAGTHLFWAHSCFQDFQAFWLKRLGKKKYEALELKARYVAPVKEFDLLAIHYNLKKLLSKMQT